MRRGPKPAKSRAESKLSVTRRSKDDDARIRDLERQLAEAQEQQTATSEILRVIRSSPTDLQPVLDAVAKSAARLCASHDASIFRLDGEVLRLVAHHGPVRVPPSFVMPAVRGLVGGRAVLDRQPIQVADLQMQTEEFPEGSAIAREHGFHTLLSVPLLREGAAIGIIALRRIEMQPFTEAQIALLQTFADQAVIAIENVRLFNETNEGLERQTATADILRVIGSSPTDVQPVFEAIARSGVSVCAALGCAVFAIEGDIIRLAATHGVRPERLERFRQEYPAPLDTKIDTAQTIRERRVFHLADIEHNPNATASDVENARLAGYRTRLMVPMVRGDRALGLIAVTREAPTPFSDQQVALLKTFADQAVIAIENVRLFKELEGRNRELTEALEQQTATSEILGVISSSPIDTQPVFDTIARNALRLCEGSSAIVSRYDGELMHLAAHAHVTSEGVDHIVRTFPMRPSRTSMHGRAVLEGTVVHVRDVRADLEYDQRISQALQNRSSLAVPMLRDGRPVGAIAIGRYEVRPFTDTQIALLQTFADQAVIAIENVRLFKELEARNRELTEALEQQTATSEILGVISSSPTDVTPVFDAICRSAVRLLGAHQGGVFRFDGKLVHIAALTSLNPEAEGRLRMRFPQAPNPHAGSGRAIVEKRVFQIPDTEEFPFEGQRATARDFGFRRSVWVPMIREEQVIGVLSVNGREPGPYSEREIALLQTFADQAVIALENVRLFTELQTSNRDLTTALNTQTATSDILRVISRSQTDVQPVFDAIVTSAVRLLEGYSGVLTRVEGDQIQLAALTSINAAFVDAAKATYPRPLYDAGAHARAIRDRAPINIADVETDRRLPEPGRVTARIGGYSSFVAVPLVHHDEALGALGIGRSEPGGFTDDEIALLQTFADQAVIAIENVRLFTELQTRT